MEAGLTKYFLNVLMRLEMLSGGFYGDTRPSPREEVKIGHCPMFPFPMISILAVLLLIININKYTFHK